MLYPSQFAMGGTGHPKFIAQVHKHNLEVQNSRTFAKAMQGYRGKVEDRKQLKQLGTTDKGKMTQLVMNQRFIGAKVGDFSVGKPDKMVVGGDRREQGINVETELGEQNPVGNNKRSPLKFKSIWNEHGYGNKHDLRNPDWTGVGLIVEVNRKGKRSVVWNSYKGGLRSSIWVNGNQREQVVGPSRGSRAYNNPVVYKCGLRSSKWVC